MRRTLTALLILLLLGSTIVEAGSIDALTMEEINGPKIPASFRDGVIVGVLHAVSASGGMQCAMMMSSNTLKARLEAALQAKEISGVWTVYHASLYVLVRAGCTATEPKPAPMEQPNA